MPLLTSQSLTSVAGPQAGRTAAPEADPIGPVEPAHVAATLPFLTRHAAGLVRLLRLTGCRPGEACRLTRGQIDTSAAPWLYRPARHKTRHTGKSRVIPLGPKARALLDGFPTAGPDDPVFSPWAAPEERYAALRAARKSKVQPSQRDRRKTVPARRPGAFYTTNAVAHAVAKAADPPVTSRLSPPTGRRTRTRGRP